MSEPMVFSAQPVEKPPDDDGGGVRQGSFGDKLLGNRTPFPL